MRTLYRLLSAGQVALGVIHVSATAVLFKTLSPNAVWFASAGFAIALTGALNLLRQAYGAAAPGVRRVAWTANATLAAFSILSGVVMGASPAGWAVVAILSGGPAVLSTVPSAQRPANPSA
jgi:hypothetical protein